MNQLVPVSAHGFTVSEVERVATAIAQGGLFGSRDPNAVLTLCLLAQAEGQHPAVVFRDYHIISGKPAKKAEAMLRDFITAGGKIEWHQLDDTCADATFSHPSGGSARISWDENRVKQAQLGGNGMYRKYPRQMLRSRVISEGVRTVFPGATSGLYVEEEVSSFEPKAEPPHDPQTGEIVAVETIEAPAAPMQTKLAGITKIKAAVRDMKERGNAATDLAEFNAIAAECAEPCALLAEHQHEWWLGKDRDGNEFESIPAWLARRRAELSEPSALDDLIERLQQCETKAALDTLLIDNEQFIAELDGAESRRFQQAYDLREEAVRLVATVSA